MNVTFSVFARIRRYTNEGRKSGIRKFSIQTLYLLYAWIALPQVCALEESEASLGYDCISSKCVYNPRNAEYSDLSSCITSCRSNQLQSLQSELSDVSSVTITSSKNGTCRDCGLIYSVNYNFPKILSSLDLTVQSLERSACTFTSTVALDIPSLWTPTGTSTVLSCYLNTVEIPCKFENNVSTLSLGMQGLTELIHTKRAYQFQVSPISTRSNPGSFTEVNNFYMVFDGDGCLDTLNGDKTWHMQKLKLSLTSNSYKLIGAFGMIKMTAQRNEIMSLTSVKISFDNGAELSRGAILLLRVADNVEAAFAEMIREVTNAKLMYSADNGIQTLDLDVNIGNANISFKIPGSFHDTLLNGHRLQLTFDQFRNPSDSASMIDTMYLSAYQGTSLAVDNSAFPFYTMQRAQREMKSSPLDVASIVVFGVCLLSSLLIIKRNGLHLTMSTLWTDMVAISALFSYACACTGSVMWVIRPTKLYVFCFTAQYYFNTIMILSLCFHWATVLSFRGFKKLTLKSPVVLAYFIVNAVILTTLIVTMCLVNERLHCIYDVEILQCTSSKDCGSALAAGGKTVREGVITCKMQFFYLLLGGGFIVYTILLMILACMVMGRGRHLMLVEDPLEPRIRKSLAIFYSIVATTCVLYISAQVIYIAQYVSFEGEYSELSDPIWYILITWLPQGLPPLLLLCLQWNPQTDSNRATNRVVLLQGSSKENLLSTTPCSSGSSPNPHSYSKLMTHRLSTADSVFGAEDMSTKLRLIVRLKLPPIFHRMCFVSLDFYTSPNTVTRGSALRAIGEDAAWIRVGTTERVSVTKQDNHATFPFVAVLEVPVVGPASNTLLRFTVHASTLSPRENSLLQSNSEADYIHSELDSGSNLSDDPSAPLSYKMTMFQPILEFTTSSQAVLDAAASSRSLNIHPLEDSAGTLLEENRFLKAEIETILQGQPQKAELSIHTVMMPGELTAKEEHYEHKRIGNLVRFFQYDSNKGNDGLVVEDLQESVYANAIPRQVLEVITVQRQHQADKAREDLRAFLNQKKDKQLRGFYGTLIGRIQDEDDTAVAKEWLQARVQKRKAYVSTLRKHIQLLVSRDKHKRYFKASVEKTSEDLLFVPINLHIQDLLIGPTKAFTTEESRRSSPDISIYEFTTVGAFAAHLYKFSKGGIMSLEARLSKMQDKITNSDLDVTKWPEEIRDYDDLSWDLQARMDCSFTQAMAALTASFVRKIEIAIQNPDPSKGENMLHMLSKLGYLFHVESLLSTHGKEIGMIEDMASAIANLSNVVFIIQDVRHRPANRFSFRVSRRAKESHEEACVVKVQVSSKPSSNPKCSFKYVITVQVITNAVDLPDRIANGGEISIVPLLFTHGINEMQTIANNTERAKTELQDMINMNNLKPLRAYCERYSRLCVALSSGTTFQHMSKDSVAQAYHQLESCVMDAAQSLVKTKRPEILQRSSDLCRALGGGRVTICKSAKDRTAMSVTLEQVRILHRHHNLPEHRIPATVSVMRSHGVRIENALKNTGKRQFAFNKLQRSLLPEEYRCPDQVGGGGNVS